MTLHQEILAGEKAELEFKEARPKDALKYVKTVVAFANGRGGRLVFGVENETRRILGVDSDSVFREAICNAVFHRNYLEPSEVYVALYDDRLEITSPGGLVRDMTLEQAEHGYSKIRNDGLALALSYMKEVEGWGGGVARYFTDWTAAGLPRPRLEETPGFFKVVFDRKRKTNPGETVNEIVAGDDNEHVREHVCEHVCEQVDRLILSCKGEMTEKELREAVGVKNRPNFTVRYLSRALEGGFLERTAAGTRSPAQKYRLTAKGRALAAKLMKKGGAK